MARQAPSCGSGALARLVIGALATLLLAACGGTSVQQPTSISYFTAQPLEQGDGAWRLSWSVPGAELVNISGQPRPGTASINVTPSGITDYVLQMGSLEQTITLAPVDSVAIAGGDQTVFVSQNVTFTATVAATGSDSAPSQSVTWSSSNQEVLQIDAAGTGEALAAGEVTVSATSLQDSSVSTSITVQVMVPEPAVIESFGWSEDVAALEAGSPVSLSWTVTGAAAVTVTEMVTDDELRTVHADLNPASGTLQLELPTDKGLVNYLLTARNAVGDEVSQLLLPEPLPLPGWICSDPDDVITFNDPVLEAAVWRIYSNTDLDPGDGVLRCGMVQQDYFTPVPTPSDEYGLMEQHNAIIINRCNQTEDPIVQSLEGIQHLSTLLRLELMCNEIEDISRLSGLTSLQELNLDQNRISDISALAGLTDLQVLGLYQNEVEDLAPLSGHTELRILYLSENHVKDLTPLAGLVNVEHLWLYNNCRVMDGPRPSDCLQDLTGIENMTQLRSLVIHVNEITDISAINAEMDQLELVFASQNLISDVTSLQDLAQLSTARLDTNLIADIAPLAANTALPSSAEPYYWERVFPGTAEFPPNRVVMPVSGLFSSHVALGENCLDVGSPELDADLATLAGRGAMVEAADIAQGRPACSLTAQGLTFQPAPFNPEGLLREDSRWYRNR